MPKFETMMTRHPRMDKLVIALGTNDSRDITDQCVPKALVATKSIANARDAKLRELGEGFAKLAAKIACEYVSLFGSVAEATMTKDGVHPAAHGHAAMMLVLLPDLLK